MQKLSVSLFVFIVFLTSLKAQPFPGKIGVNLDGIGGSALEFPNVIPTASAWQSIANNGSNATTDTSGWPTEDFRVVLFDFRPFNAWNNAPDDPAKYVTDMSGTYSLSFKGRATLTSWSDAPIQFQNQVYDTASNTSSLNIVFPPGGGANAAAVGNYGFLMVNFTQTQYSTGVKGVKGIRLMRPGYQHNNPQLFRTSYLNAISPFSTLRFMDYLHTNNSDGGYPKKQTWTDRQLPDAPRYTKGAPWEVIIALANFTGKDIWINIPVDADSVYIVELAKLLKNTLRNDIAIYLEYSNEVWNGSFTQYKYNYDAVLLSAADADIRNSTSFDDRRRARRTAKQVIQAGKIFEQVMGISVASRTRIRPVFAWQIGGWLPWYDDVLNWMNVTYGPPKNYIYGIASAPYFGESGAGSNATPLQVVSAMSASSDANVTSIKTLAQLANQWQLKHLQYEGGPDNGGGSTVNIGNRIQANRLPEMKTAVIHNYKDNWFSSNANGTAPIGTNDVVNYFVMSGRVSRYGCWGATEDLNYLKSLASAPKYDALCNLTGMCGNEPAITVATPLNNAIAIANSPLTITTNATDPDGFVKKVEFFSGTTFLGVDSMAPFSMVWTPFQAGATAIMAKAIDNQGKYTFTDATVVNVVAGTNGISKQTFDEELKLFPVPTQNILHVSLNKSDYSPNVIEIFNLLGKKLITAVMSSNEMDLNTSSLQNGIYLICIRKMDGKSTLRKFEVLR